MLVYFENIPAKQKKKEKRKYPPLFKRGQTVSVKALHEDYTLFI